MRLVTSNDYDQYYILINQFRETSFSKTEFSEYLDNLPKNIQIWVLEKDDDIIGSATVIYEPKLIHNMSTYAHIEDVCILEKYRNKGFGSILLKELFKKIKETGCYKVTLVCNENTAPFYIKNGLEIRGVQCCQLISNL